MKSEVTVYKTDDKRLKERDAHVRITLKGAIFRW
jgi:hypothetical protein